MKLIINITFLCLTIVLTNCNRQPEANFIPSNYEVFEGEEVIFMNTSKLDKSSLWDFDDGNQSTETHPKHTYDRYGVYTVQLNSYSKNEKKEDTYNVNITVKNELRQKIIGVWKYDSTRQETYNALNGDTIEVTRQNFINSTSDLNFQNDSYITGTVYTYSVNWTWEITPEDKIIINDENPADIIVDEKNMYIELKTTKGGYTYHNFYYYSR